MDRTKSTRTVAKDSLSILIGDIRNIKPAYDVARAYALLREMSGDIIKRKDAVNELRTELFSR